MKLDRTSIDGNYLRAGKRRFVPIGAHWVPAKAALQWAQCWDEADIEADFAKMRELGFNVVRFDLFWAWFEPRPGDYSEEAFAQFDRLLVLSRKYGIYLHPTLFIGGEVGEAFWDLPWRQGRHLHEDPEMLRLQTDHAAEFARRYKGEEAILAWDLTDEPPFWPFWGKTTDAMAVNWTRLLSWAMRREDPSCLVCVGTSMEDLGRGPFRPDTIAAEVDFLSSHPYPIYAPGLFPDPMLSERGSYCAAFQTALCLGAGKPMMIHEYGASSAQYDPERVGKYDRVTMFSALAHGASGFMPWCYTDAAPETWKRVPYLRAPHETQFGVCTWDRKDRPAGVAVREFAALLEALDLEGLEPAKGEAAIVVPHEWGKFHGDMKGTGLPVSGAIPYTSVQECHAEDGADEDNLWIMGGMLSSFVLARRAGLKAELPRERGSWEDAKLLFLPSPLTSTERNFVHLHTDFWGRAEAWVRNGGGLYASLCADAAIPAMETLFGARLVDHAPVEEAVITMTEDFSGLRTGESFAWKPQGGHRSWPALLAVDGGRVVGVDGAGRPALVANELGKGKTLVCAYPIESYLAKTPSAFEGDESTHRLYRAFADWLGAKPPFETSDPSAEVAVLSGAGRGYAVIANHSARDLDLTVTSSIPVLALELVGPARRGGLAKVPGGWKLALAAHDGAILSWRS